LGLEKSSQAALEELFCGSYAALEKPLSTEATVLTESVHILSYMQVEKVDKFTFIVNTWMKCRKN
jgi:hypothetical protein